MSIIASRRKPRADQELHPAVREWLLTGKVPERGEPGRSEVLKLRYLYRPQARALWRRHRAELLKVDPHAWAAGLLD